MRNQKEKEITVKNKSFIILKENELKQSEYEE
jgi:hypothetical protein